MVAYFIPQKACKKLEQIQCFYIRLSKLQTVEKLVVKNKDGVFCEMYKTLHSQHKNTNSKGDIVLKNRF